MVRRRPEIPEGQGLSAGTLKNRVAHLRWWAEKVGKVREVVWGPRPLVAKLLGVT